MTETRKPLIDQPTAAPTRKVGVGLAAGSIITLVAYALGQAGYPLPADVVAAAQTLAVFATQWQVRDRQP